MRAVEALRSSGVPFGVALLRAILANRCDCTIPKGENMRKQFVLFTLVSVACGAQAQDCAYLSGVLDQARAEGIKSFAGNPLPDDQWETDISLANFDSCAINRHEGDYTISCDSAHISDEDNANELYRRIRESLVSCLSDPWNVYMDSEETKMLSLSDDKLIVGLSKLFSYDLSLTEKAMATGVDLPSVEEMSGWRLTLSIMNTLSE